MTFVTATLNDSFRGSLLVVDTGAATSLISPSEAQRLGITIPNDIPKREIVILGGRRLEVPFVRIKKIKVGDAVIENMEVAVFDAFPRTDALSGLLGADFLHQFRFTLDRANGRLILEPHGR